MALATLTVDLILKAGGFESDLGRASKTAQKRMKEIESAASKAGAVIGAALVSAAGAVVYAVKGAIDHADELYNTAQKIGVTTEALSGLEFAAKQSGLELEELQGGLAKMVKFQAAAAEGNKEAANTFQAFGIALSDANGQLRDSQAVLLDWAGVFADLPDGAEKSALAMRIFGKSGEELIPLLNEGKDGIAAFIAKAKELGLVIDNETGAAADAFNDQLDELKHIVDGVATQVASDLLPDLLSLAHRFADSAEKGGGLSEAAHDIADAFRLAIDTAGTLYHALGYIGDKYLQVAALIHKAQASSIPGRLLGMDADLADAQAKEYGKAADAHAQAFWDYASGMARTGNRGGPTGYNRNGREVIHGGAELGSPPHGGGGGGSGHARSQIDNSAKEMEEATRAATEFHDQLQDLKDEIAGPLAQAFTEHTRKLAELAELQTKGKLTSAELQEAQAAETKLYERKVDAIKAQLSPLGEVVAQQERELALLGLTGAALQTASDLYGKGAEDVAKYGAAIAANNEQLEATKESLDFRNSMQQDVEGAFASIIDGSKSAKEAFNDMAKAILSDIARMLAHRWAEQLFNSFWPSSGAAGAAGAAPQGSAKGNVFDHGMALTAYARGGIVDRPTLFPMARGMGLMGEAGPEAVMPLARDALGRLGVRARGGGLVVNQVIKVEGRPDERTAAQIAQRSGEKVTRATSRNR
jgi:lambda family phage tail tape measure protein